MDYFKKIDERIDQWEREYGMKVSKSQRFITKIKYMCFDIKIKFKTKILKKPMIF